MHILILAAFETELSHFIRTFSDLKDITIAKRRCRVAKVGNDTITFSLSGIGTISAASTTTALCAALEPDFIIFCGVAGGLDAEQQIGDLVLGSKIIDCELYHLNDFLLGTPYESCLRDPHTLEPIKKEYNVLPLLFELGSSIAVDRLKAGIIATSNIFPAPKSLFGDIKKIGCTAIEMESVGVFKAADYYDVPVMTIRAISNLLDSAGADLGTASDALTICSKRLALFLTRFLEKMHALENFSKLKQQKIMADIITQHKLEAHPEGGWYRRTFESDDSVSAKGDALKRYHGEARAAGTSIIYLLGQDDFSAWHTVQSDETWNFHEGDPLLLRVINPRDGELTEILLGINSGHLQYTVKAGDFFSAETQGRFSLMGCMVTPGFDFRDFQLIAKSEFLSKFPCHEALARFARNEPVVVFDMEALVEERLSSFVC